MSIAKRCYSSEFPVRDGPLHLGACMRRREFTTLLGGAMSWPLAARSQQAASLRRIGCLLFSTKSRVGHRYLEAFRQGLRELGHVEGQNIALEYRSAEGRIERFPVLADELVRLNVDVIAALSNGATHSARRATHTIPIVCFNLGDPVGEGLVASLARPGGNVTGFSIFGTELVPKALTLLNETVPKASRIAGLWSPGSLTNRTAEEMLQSAQATARTLAIELRLVRAQYPDDLDDAFSTMALEHAQALLVLPSPLSNAEGPRIVALAMRHRLPSMGWTREFAEAGGLMAYGSNIADNWRRGAAYVDKILKGAKPAELPIQQATKFELVVNLKTANALTLSIPDSVLARADEVIE